MATTFNNSPYFDDFDPEKNFYRVLFKPGYAVQARELNQLQTILQHQISAVGNHLFKKNAMVVPGGIALHTSADIVSVVNIADPTVLLGKTITNASSFDPTDDATLDGYITALVLAATPATDTAPAALYVKYFKTQADGRSTFDLNEQLQTVDTTLVTFNVDTAIGSTTGKVATISAGTFYTKEIFVDTSPQSIIVEVRNTTITNAIIGLSIEESIVTSDDDSSLLDNAFGAPNQYAPGADRYKISLRLERLDDNTVVNDDKFIKMMEIINDVVVYVNNKTEYAELMKTLARRTYDANGNFIVSGLETSLIDDTSDINNVWVNVTRGRSYLGGYEYDQIADTAISITKPRDANYQEIAPQVVTYSTGMTYFFIAGGSYIKEIPDSDTLVQFLDAAPGTGGAAVIGYGVFKEIQYDNGTAGVNDVYRAFFDYISLEKGKTIQDIGGVKAITANEGAPVLHQLFLTNVIGTFTEGNTIVPAEGTAGPTGLIYRTVSNNIVYVVKNTLNDVPETATVKDSTTGAVATRLSNFITNYDPSIVPMIEIDASTIKTLWTDQGLADENTTSYSTIFRQDFSAVTLGISETSDPAGTYNYFEEPSSTDYFGFITTPGSEAIVSLDGLITIINNGQNFILNPSAEMDGLDISIYATINKTQVEQVNKTAISVSAATGFQIPTPSASWMSLGHQDVIRLDKIVEGRTVVVTDATWATNVATITVTYDVSTGDDPYNLQIGDTVVVRGIESDNNLTGDDNVGYNGIFTVTAKTQVPSINGDVTTYESTMQYTVTVDPGVYVTASDATVALAPVIATDTDITSRYILDSGNTATVTGTGLIKLRKGVTPPQGQIGAKYTYYTLSAGNTYVSVDSYGDYTGDLSYIGEIDNIVDDFQNVIEVRRYMDFRTRPSNYFFKNIGTIASGSATLNLKDLNLSGQSSALVGKYVVGPSHLNGAIIDAVNFNPATGNTELTLNSNSAANLAGIYYIGLNTASLSLIDPSAGAKSFEFPKDSTRMTYEYVKFLPKNVVVYLGRSEDLVSIQYSEVDDLRAAQEIRRNEFKLPLTYIAMSPYTVNARDISVTKFDNPVYQMLDIHHIKQRVDRNEYYASLALNRDITGEIQDAAVETFTTSARGFWNENFMNPLGQDYSSPDFECTVYDKSYAAPGTVTRTVNLQLDTTLYNTTWAQTGDMLTVKYTESRAFGNDRASRSNNLNPFNVVQWNGTLKLYPSVDNWIDTTVQLSATINNTTVEINLFDVSPTELVTKPATVPAIPPAAPVVTIPASIMPTPTEEIVTEVTIEKANWGRDSRGGTHSITFTWKTNKGRTGRVNTDRHLSSAIRRYGWDGKYAKSLINKKYTTESVKEYLHAGTHFDQKSPKDWR